MKLYSQRDPRWASHPYGYGPGRGAIGPYGCFLSCDAMIANDSGHPVTPATLDEMFSRLLIYRPEAAGNPHDLLPDNALDIAFAGRYHTVSFPGFNAAAIRAAVPSKDTYVVLWISTASVPTHFVIAYSADAALIADPWTGAVGRLSGYGGPVAVHKTILVKALPAPAPPPVVVAPPAVTPPVVVPPVVAAPPVVSPVVVPVAPPLGPPAPKATPPAEVDFPGVLQQVLILLLRALLNLKGQTQP